MDQEWNRGNHEEAKTASRKAKMWLIIGVVTGTVLNVIALILFLVIVIVNTSSASSASEDY